MTILNDLFERMILLEEDKNSMRKRGFSDEIIERKGWRSCHPDNARVVKELETTYTREELATEMLYVPSSVRQGDWEVNPKLVHRNLEDISRNILIPYYDDKFDVVKLRPHKGGFKGQGHRVYRTESSYKTSPTCVIAESEFKADAAECLGYSSIGIPGISSMSGQNWDYFLSVIDTIKAEEFVICFDNEIKDNPKHGNYKADWRGRYDTIIFAYVMATKILDAAKNCRVAILPAEWMVDGKIDIDTALAQKHTSAELTKVINDALPPKRFLTFSAIPPRHAPYVSRRIKMFFFKSQVVVRNNSFYQKDSVNSEGVKTYGKKLTNCKMYIKNVYEDPDNSTGEGLRRDIMIEDPYGLESKMLPIKAASMSNKSAFKTWLMGQGNYLFYGDDKDVTHIWEHLFHTDESDIVYLMNRCGYVKEHDFWVLANGIYKDKQFYPSDELGICWVEEVGYKLNPLNNEMILPTLKTEGDFNMETFINYLSDTTDVEETGMAMCLIAWTLGNLYLDPIHAKFHMYPLLFLYGAKGSGKSTVMRWLLMFFGQQNAVSSLKMSSPVGITRLLSYFSSLPIVAEDWRDDFEFRKFIPLFLGVYGRQSGSKGVKTKFGLAETDVRGSLSILGEEVISDNGVASRCVTFYMPQDRIKERLDLLEDMATEASAYTHKLLMNYDATRVMQCIETALKRLQQEAPKVERRVIFNYAILEGVYEALINYNTEVIRKFIATKILESSVSITVGDKIHRYSEDFLFGVTEGLILPHHYKVDYDKAHVTMWVRGVCDIMNKYYNRKTDHSTLIIKHFSQKEYFVGASKSTYSGVSGKLPSITLDINKMPDTMRGFYEGILVDRNSPGYRVGD